MRSRRGVGLEMAARDCALRLLRLSDVYDEVTVPAATPRDWLVPRPVFTVLKEGPLLRP
jgi:hypothetical protein